MKQFKLLLTLTTLALLSAGCAKEMHADGSLVATVNTSTPVPSTNGGTSTTSPTPTPTPTNTATFYVDSYDAWNSFVGGGYNNPTNFTVNVNVYDIGGGKFAGRVTISYIDVGIQHYDYFDSPAGTAEGYSSYGTAKDVGVPYAVYNSWFNNNTNFSAFFQDKQGAVVLVIDGQGPNQGDGQGPQTVSGSIWFKNFSQQFSPLSPYRPCWMIYRGPYDCRSTTVMDKSSPYPSDGYTRLGTFSNLNRGKAFNQ
jgi:hypothetical protein